MGDSRSPLRYIGNDGKNGFVGNDGKNGFEGNDGKCDFKGTTEKHLFVVLTNKKRSFQPHKKRPASADLLILMFKLILRNRTER